MNISQSTNWQSRDFARALVRPADGATLWREKPFEIRVGDEWISGRFDRVVFTGTGADRRATIYDFKTDVRQRGEDEGAFARRLAEAYRGQLLAYRRALAVLAGLPERRIACILLLNATRQAVNLV